MTDNTTPAAPEGNFDVRERAEQVAARVYPELHHVHMKHAYADAFERGYREAEISPRGTIPAEQISDPNTIPDDVADAAQIEHYEFVFGQSCEYTARQLGIARQAWKCAIAVAIDKMNEK